MKRPLYVPVEEAKLAALDVLINNATGPYHGLPRTAAWGYPEPYTRDLMIAGLGILASGNEYLIERLRRVLEVLARNQTVHGHMPSLVHDPNDLGASDTTPLFLLTLACFRQVTGEREFLDEAAQKALTWMDYRSPEDRTIIAQQPTSDWRDEHWVLGYGLFVNAVAHAYLRLYARDEQADTLRELMNRLAVTADLRHRHVHSGLIVPHKPYYALWSYKIYADERFDLLGNSLAILSHVASHTRCREMVAWVERECDALSEAGHLVVDLPPCLFPYMQPGDPDWRPRYETFGRPGEYHNGGIWPFICGFYVAAIAATGRRRLAERKLSALTELVRPAREHDVAFGFNEWFRAQDGQPAGQDWQTWSAGMYLYAAAAVESGAAPFFEVIPDPT